MSDIKLGDVCEFINGGAWSDKEYASYGIPVLKVTNCKSSGFSISEISYLPLSSSVKYEKNKLHKNDVIIATVGSHPNLKNSAAGRSCVVNTLVEGFYLNQNAVCIRSLDENILDQRYLGYLAKHYPFQHFIQMRGRGAANQMRIAISSIKEYSFALPDIDIQHRKADILSAYDDLIENNQKQIKLLEEAAQRLYKEWFIDLRFPGYETTPIVDGVPDGWKKQKLSDFAEIVMGQSPKSEYYNTKGQGLPFHQGVTSYGTRFVTNETYSTEYTRIALPNSILFSVRAPVGRMNITKDKIAIGRGLSAINHRQELQSFLLYMLKEHFFKDNLIGNGAIYASITKEDLRGQQFLTPSQNLAVAYNDLVKTIDLKIDIIDAQIKLLEQARNRLLPILMSGELEV